MSTPDPGARRSVFDDLHRRTEDPWEFSTSLYEIAKRAATIEALPDQHFGRILEIGCSTGYLSQALAQKGDTVLALDVSSVAVARASARVGAATRIRFHQAEVPEEWPAGTFDLIVFSEVLYFMTSEEIRRCAQLAERSLAPHGLCLLVNWTGQNDLEISGEAADSIFAAGAQWRRHLRKREDNYLLRLLSLNNPVL